MELTLDAEQGMEGVDEMESSKRSPAAQGGGRRSFELELVRRRGATPILQNPSMSLPLYACPTRLLVPPSAKSSRNRSHETPIPVRAPGLLLAESRFALASTPPCTPMRAPRPA
jgi:hypothetical protein